MFSTLSGPIQTEARPIITNTTVVTICLKKGGKIISCEIAFFSRDSPGLYCCIGSRRSRQVSPVKPVVPARARWSAVPQPLPTLLCCCRVHHDGRDSASLYTIRRHSPTPEMQLFRPRLLVPMWDSSSPAAGNAGCR